MVTFPITAVAWLEATTCDFFFVYLGGHLIYDLSTSVPAMVYYFLMKRHALLKDGVNAKAD
jgi:hypothetical protein